MIRHLRRGPGPVLFCLPFSGGASHSFAPLARHLPDWSEVVGVDPPGHGPNTDPPVRDLEALVDVYEEVAGALEGRPLVPFGHSLGGLAAYRLAQRLERAGRPPAAAVISGAVAPEAPHAIAQGWLNMSDAELIDDVVRLGVTHPEVIADAGFRAQLLATLRADAEVTVSVREVDPAPVAAPVHLFAGRDDTDASPALVAAWSPRLARYRLHVFEGGHMFVITEAPAVARVLGAVLLEAWRAAASPA